MAEKNIKRLLRALTGPIQALELLFMAFLTERRIDTAVGAQLDQLGKIVGESREGRIDAIYRRFIRARIATNNSDGLVADEIKVAKLVLGMDGVTVRVRRIGIAAIVVTLMNVVVDSPIADIVHTFAQQAADAGVRVLVEYWPSVEADLFSYAPDPDGGAGTGKGYDTDTPGGGGAYAGAIG